MFCIEKRVRWKNFLIYFLGIHILISTVESQSGLGEWGGWGACSVSCAGGDQMRTRPCLDRRLCGGPVSEGRNCNNVPCPIHGAWEAWESWISCTKTCGGGTSARKRSCDAPSPSFGGRFCEGGVPENIDNESVEWQWRACNTHRCEGDRGTGPLPAVVLPTLAPKFTTARSRVPLPSAPTPPPVAQPRPPPPVRQPSPPVRQPSPSVRQPSLQPGAQPGWSAWGAWGACSASCAGGDRTRTRVCLDNRFCSGTEPNSENCNNVPCPIHGAWEAWESWISCTKTCGGGTSARKRSCDAPSPSFGGRFCVGGVPENIDNESVEWQWRACNTQRCEGDAGPLRPVVLPTLAPKFTTARSRISLPSAPTPSPRVRSRPSPPVRSPAPSRVSQRTMWFRNALRRRNRNWRPTPSPRHHFSRPVNYNGRYRAWSRG